ncbi:MAG: hypothetical protein DCF21_04140 [Leptolyngbya sp.]|jgi:hypothetical protein|nr:MAG: hypothetical protein DCF21_04140 [Leptolyngbya sp.]
MLEVTTLRSCWQQLIHQIQRWIYRMLQIAGVQKFMRVGYAAKGMLYGLFGLFALHDLIHDQDVVNGSQGVLASLGNHYLGSILLGPLAVGLMGYVLWRFVQASLDPGHRGSLSSRRVLQRCGYAVSGFTYLGLGYTAGKLALGLAVDLDDTIDDVATVLFERTVGPLVLATLGCCIVAIGLTYIYGAVSESYINPFRKELYSLAKRWVIIFAKIGLTARGIGFVLIGAYLIKAAYLVDDESAGGLGHVFDQLDDQPWGELWLGTIALGFIAYAGYMVVAAFYRKFPSFSPKRP